MSQIAKFLVKTDQHRYDVLQGDRPLRLFFDVEWPVEGVGDERDAANKLTCLQQCVREYGKGHAMFKDSIVLDASRCGKRSYHMFRKIDMDLKIFVLGFVRCLNDDKKLTN